MKIYQQLVKLEKSGKIKKKEKQRLAGFRAAISRAKGKGKSKPVKQNKTAKQTKPVKAKGQIKQGTRKNKSKAVGFAKYKVNRDALIAALQKEPKELAPTQVVKVTWAVIKNGSARKPNAK